MTTQDELALAEALRTGNSAAFTQIFLANYPWLVRIVLRYVHSVDIAEDIAQDVFTQLWERRAGIDPTRSVRAYLVTTARNRALNLLAHDDVARRHAEHVVAATVPGRPPSDPSPEDTFLADELSRVAADRLATLSPRLREIYHMSRTDGLSPAEIGAALGIATQTVYVQLGKALQALYPALAPWLEEYGMWAEKKR